jgi:lipopolysaccharide/colanic/teichoic acid biosynthesis glycosyltransferase
MPRKFFSPPARRRASEPTAAARPASAFSARPSDLLPEPLFLRALSLERRRSERSGKRFLLMMVEFGAPARNGAAEDLRDKTVAAILTRIRETDVPGWYSANETLSVIFTELGAADERAALQTLRGRVMEALECNLTAPERRRLCLSFHWFPDEGLTDLAEPPAVATMYPDLARRDAGKRIARVVKRGMDIFGSTLALMLLSPCFLVIAVAIKASSSGPIFFRQSRLGQYGVPFTFLKFRSMHAHSDSQPHREFIKRYIAGADAPSAAETNGSRPYKITNDPRVTRVGRFLRRTSLDEIPQFLNVLRGEMSLVGPRPPIPYEIETYDIWHRRRLMEVRPGITGLWQVKGRSKVCFNDMVRLDLEYARRWSVRLDLKILLQTPRAVLFGGGAY